MPDRRDDSFQRALDEAQRQDRTLQGPTLNGDGSGPAGGPRVRASLEFGPAPGSGGEARFGLALDWTDEPADRPGRQTPAFTEEAAANPADTPAEIAAELGLPGPLTPDQLGFRWRNFVWRNHPDRQPAHARERANARVAIANTLYDRTRRDLAKRR
jgi:hypothetical protein